MNTMQSKTQQMALTGMAVALVFVTTMYIKIPNPLDGYFNLGDGMILLFCSILNPLGSFLAGGVGSALADLAGGYPHYILWTLAIKGLEGVVVCLLFKKFGYKIRFLAYGIGTVIMVSGYFFAKWFLKMNFWIALSGVFENILQSLVGVVVALILLPRLMKLVDKNHQLEKK